MDTTDDLQPALRLPGELSFELKLPPLPRTVAELSRLVDDSNERQPISALKEIIAADPIAARLTLKRVNSAYYGLRRKAATAEQAVVLLGFKNVHELLITASMIQLRTVFSSDEHAEVYRQMIRHSIMTAGLARATAQFLHLSHAELAYTAGLMHNIGRIVLLYNVPDLYEALWSSCDAHCVPAPEQEESIFGTTYAKLGAHAASEWNLSDKLATVLQHQSDPDQLVTQNPSLHKLTLTVAVAQLVTRESTQAADLLPIFEDHPVSPALKSLAEACTVEDEELIRVIESGVEEVEAFSRMMLEE